MRKTHEVERAERATLIARQRFAQTLSDLRDRLDPDRLAQEAWTVARNGVQEVAADALVVVRRRPLATGVLVTSLLLFLARGPLWRLVQRRFLQRRATRGGQSGLRTGRKETTT